MNVRKWKENLKNIWNEWIGGKNLKFVFALSLRFDQYETNKRCAREKKLKFKAVASRRTETHSRKNIFLKLYKWRPIENEFLQALKTSDIDGNRRINCDIVNIAIFYSSRPIITDLNFKRFNFKSTKLLSCISYEPSAIILLYEMCLMYNLCPQLIKKMT